MAKKPAKRSRPPKPRVFRTDERGIQLTSDYRPFTILPSDFAEAKRQPSGTPKKATRQMSPPRPTTVIPELNVIEFTHFAYQTVVEAIEAAGKVQLRKLNPKGGANLRYRIELAAAFLTHVMQHAYEAGLATKSDPKELLNLATNLVIRRAQEIYGQDGA
jgi:hypothetical protein